MNGKTYVVESFPSLLNFQQEMRRRPSCFSEKSSITGSESFTGTPNYETAEQLLFKGYDAGLKELKETYELACKAGKRADLVTNIVGFLPHVPNAILGIPQSMLDFEEYDAPCKTINLVYDPSANGGYGQNYFVDGGKKVVELIAKLENNNIRVNLTVIAISSSHNGFDFICAVKMKSAQQKMELKKMCFPLTHPSWLRRFGFRWMETSSDIKKLYGNAPRKYKGLQGGYGHTTSEQNIIKELNLTNSVFLTVHRANQMTADELLKMVDQQLHSQKRRGVI